MAVRVEKLARRKQTSNSVDTLFSAFFTATMLHIGAVIAIFIFQTFYSSFVPPKKIEKKPYAVHMIDSGSASSASQPLSKQKTAKKTKNFKVPTKNMVTEKDMTTVKKEKTVQPKKVKPAEKKIVKKVVEVKKEKVAKPKVNKKEEAVQKKEGGKVDIQAFPYEWYIQLLDSKIYNNWAIIGVDVLAERAASVGVFFVINRDGQMQGIKIEHSSGQAAVDSSAIKAVMDSAPFPPLPAGYKENTLEVHFAFKVTPQR